MVAHASESERRVKAAIEFLEVSRLQKMMIEGACQSLEMNLRLDPSLVLSEKQLKGVLDIHRKYFRKAFYAPESQQMLTHYYADHFTEDEIRQLTEFVSSPLGQKVLRTVPDYERRVLSILDAVTQQHVPDLEAELASFMRSGRASLSSKGAENLSDEELTYQRCRDDFGSDEMVVILFQREDTFTSKHLGKVSQLRKRFRKAPYIQRIESLFDTSHIHSQGGMVASSPLLHKIPKRKSQLESLRKQALENPMLVGNLISSDGTELAMVLYLESDSPQIRNEILYSAIMPALDASIFFSEAIHKVHGAEYQGSSAALVGTTSVYLVVNGEKNDFKKTKHLQSLFKLTNFIRSHEELDVVHSLADYIAAVNHEMYDREKGKLCIPETDAVLSQYFLFFHYSQLAPYVTGDYSRVCIRIRSDIDEKERLMEVLNEIRKEIDSGRFGELDYYITGKALLN